MIALVGFDKWKPWQRWLLICTGLLFATVILREYNLMSANTIHDMRLTLHADHEFPDPAVRELVLAAAVGDSGRIDQLAHMRGFNPNATGVHYRITPLIWAVLAENTAGIKALLRVGANPNQRVTNISPEEIRAIIGQPPKPITRSWDDARSNLMAYSNESAITMAVQTKRIDHLRLLLDAGGDPNIDGRTVPAMFDCKEKDHHVSPMLKLMIEHGGDPNLRDRRGAPMIEDFVSRGQYSTAIYLMEQGANPVYSDRDQLPFTSTGQTPPPPPDDLNGYDRNYAAVQIQRATGINGDHGSPAARKVRQMMIERGVKFPVYDASCRIYKDASVSRFDRLLKCHMPLAYIEKIIAWNRREGRLGGPYPYPYVTEIERDYLAYKAKHPQ